MLNVRTSLLLWFPKIPIRIEIRKLIGLGFSAMCVMLLSLLRSFRVFPPISGRPGKLATVVYDCRDCGRRAIHDLVSESPKMVYLPFDQFWDVNSLRVVVRTPAGTAKTASILRTIVSSVDSNTPVSDILTYQARFGDLIARPRFAAYLLTTFAAIALLLAAIGVYGVLSFALNRRIPEIGVRLAFGAKGRDVFRLLFVDRKSAAEAC